MHQEPTIPLGYCQCGCGRRTSIPTRNTTKYGWVKGQPLRFARGHKPRERPEDRFWSRVEKTDGCWIWTGGCIKGYGAFWYEGRNVRAHRYAYELLVGPIPEGLTLDHLCRNKPCVNPAHLEPVTVGENVLRSEGITALHARKTACPQGHPYDEANTLVKPSGARACRACAREAARRRREAA